MSIQIYDWHCGLRGITRSALEKMELNSDGMEFATEMIEEVARNGLRYTEVSAPLKKAQNEPTENCERFGTGCGICGLL